MTQVPDGAAPEPVVNYVTKSPAMNYALWGDRFLAALIDMGFNLVIAFVLLAVVFGLGAVISAVGSASSSTDMYGRRQESPLTAVGPCLCCCGPTIIIPIAMLLFGLFNKVYLINKRGCSIGQGFMKLRVVDEFGKGMPVGKLVLRLLVQVAFGFIQIVELLNILWPLWDEKRQTLHDKAVGSFVIKVG